MTSCTDHPTLAQSASPRTWALPQGTTWPPDAPTAACNDPFDPPRDIAHGLPYARRVRDPTSDPAAAPCGTCFPHIDIQHTQCPCRCLTLERISSGHRLHTLYNHHRIPRYVVNAPVMIRRYDFRSVQTLPMGQGKCVCAVFTLIGYFYPMASLEHPVSTPILCSR